MTATRPPLSTGPAGATRGVLTGAAQSLAATTLPLALGLVALPVLTRALGSERIGLLLLAWSWLGIAQLLDLGLGRALVRRLADADAHGRLADDAGTVAVAERTLLALATAVALGAAAAGTWYVTRSLDLPASLHADARASVLLFAAAIPPTVAAAAPRAVLEGVRDFRAVSAIRLVVNAATFIVPLALLPATVALAPTAAVLLVVRCWAWWALRRVALRHLGGTTTTAAGDTLRTLLREGGWITVSNLLSPVLSTVDRFVIGSLVGAAAVAYYAVPHEVATKALLVPAAVTTALFPALAAAHASTPTETGALHTLALRAVAALVLPAMAVAIVAAEPIVALLGGRDWPPASARVLVWLSLGVAANALAMIPYTLLQAAGASRAVARLHLLETIPYLLLLGLLLRRHGIEGAAVAWTMRTVVDALALGALAQRRVPAAAGTFVRLAPALLLLAGGAAAMLLGARFDPWGAAVFVGAIVATTLPREVLRLVRARMAVRA